MYHAPLHELRFVITQLLEVEADTPKANGEYSTELMSSILEEAGRFAEDVLAPLNRPADVQGAQLTREGVRAPTGFAAAYRHFVDGGWPQLSAAREHGGQGAPALLSCATQEIWSGANLSFKLCPMLTQAAVEVLERFGSAEQKARFLAKLVSGQWTGTMALTESRAGSDLSLVQTRAAREGDHFRIAGQKIFITWGEHDLAENIIHMVLARIDGAPPGTRGLSLFIVPRFLVRPDGTLGAPNEVRCVSIERKLGIHASPTCTLAFGGEQGAVGYLIGEANRGLEYMFVMMNASRLSIGIDGYAVCERAYQDALSWAKERAQGSISAARESGPVPIVRHPDVRRMLLSMRCGIDAMRALTLYTAGRLDRARAEDSGSAGPRAMIRA
jgi:acyl-CoA dehydrogenase